MIANCQGELQVYILQGSTSSEGQNSMQETLLVTLDKAFVQYTFQNNAGWKALHQNVPPSICNLETCMDGILKYHYKIHSIFLAKHDDHQNQIITLQQLQDSIAILCVLQQHTVKPNSATVNVLFHDSYPLKNSA